MKIHKFKGRELLECLKRITLKTAHAGDLLTNDGEEMQGFYIILSGQCSRHLSYRSALGKALRKKFAR